MGGNYMGGSINEGTPIKMDDLGVPRFGKLPYMRAGYSSVWHQNGLRFAGPFCVTIAWQQNLKKYNSIDSIESNHANNFSQNSRLGHSDNSTPSYALCQNSAAEVH